MMLFYFPDQRELASRLACESGKWEWRHFPDGESYVRVLSNVKNREVCVLCGLEQPDAKFLPLIFLTQTLRKLGAARITLIAPYLAYMRQDKEFNAGETVTSQVFASLLSRYVDVLITIDPHLHRYASLGEIYGCECKTLSAAPLIEEWIKANVSDPVIVGPDMESEQWVANVASKVGAPHLILKKTRHGDRQVDISLPDMSAFKQCTPVLVDDIISTAGTMIKVVKLLQIQHFTKVICLATHMLAASDAYNALLKAGDVRVITTNTISHPSNAIDIAATLVQALSIGG